jgi:hypothetical protein
MKVGFIPDDVIVRQHAPNQQFEAKQFCCVQFCPLVLPQEEL